MYLKNSDGITLIEILASLVIVSIILITFYSFITQGFLFSAKNEDSLVSSNLASYVLESVQKNYATSCTESVNLISHYTEFSSGKMELNGTIYSLSLECHISTEPGLDILHVKILDSTGVKLLAETFGYAKTRSNN